MNSLDELTSALLVSWDVRASVVAVVTVGVVGAASRNELTLIMWLIVALVLAAASLIRSVDSH